MKTAEELAAAIRKKSDANFSIIYEIFSSMDRRRFKYDPVSSTPDGRSIELKKRVVNGQASHEACYNKIKEYFLKKASEFEPEKLLINFDDTAQRIDIGYGKKELQCIFPELLDLLYDNGALDGVSIFRLNWGSIDGFFTEQYKMQYKIQEEYFMAATDLADKAIVRKSLTLPEIKTDANIIIECLKKHDGIVVGEVHQHKSPKKFLIKNFELLKSQGVTTIYMEHLLDSHQNLLDTYLNSPKNAPMPKRLAVYLKVLDKEFLSLKSDHLEDGSFSNLIIQAKKVGIRVIAIDTEITYAQGVTNNYSDVYNEEDNSIKRSKALHVSALQKFETYKDKRKYIFFVGSAHVTTRYDVPGLSELFGIPNIVVHDATKNLETCTRNASHAGLTFDILLERIGSEVLPQNLIPEVSDTPADDEQAQNPSSRPPIDWRRVGASCFIGATAMVLPYTSTYIFKPLIPVSPKILVAASLITGLLACTCTYQVLGRE